MAPYMRVTAPRLVFGLDTVSQEELLQNKLSDFSWENPLGISSYLHFILMVYAPALVIFGVSTSLFSCWVFEVGTRARWVTDRIIMFILSVTSPRSHEERRFYRQKTKLREFLVFTRGKKCDTRKVNVYRGEIPR